MIETLLLRFETILLLLEAYEKPIERAQCEEAINVVRDLQAVLQDIPTPRPSFLATALQRVSTPDDPQAQADATASFTASFDDLLVLEHARSQADKVRLLLAVYAPHAQSKAQRYLQGRRGLLYELKNLVKAAKEVQISIATPRKRAHPAYLQVVRPDDQPS